MIRTPRSVLGRVFSEISRAKTKGNMFYMYSCKYKPSIQVENLRMQIYIWHMTFTHSLHITVDQWRQFWTIEWRRASPIGLTSSHVVVYLWCVFAIICWRAPNPLTMSHRLSRKGGKIVDKWTRVHGRVYMHRNGLMRLQWPWIHAWTNYGDWFRGLIHHYCIYHYLHLDHLAITFRIRVGVSWCHKDRVSTK